MNIDQLEECLTPCEGMYGPCESNLPAERAGCRTMYAEKEMNKSPFLCELCAKEYHSYWDDMWRDYWSDRL